MSTQHTDESNRPFPDEIRLLVDGRPVHGQAGQSVAGVLLTNGTSILGRSVKYHRPRGYACGFGACGNCALTLNGSPGSVSCQIPARDGDVIEMRQGWPSSKYDVMRAADLLKPLLPAGFQFRLFRKQPRLSALAGRFMAVLAGGGRMPTTAAATRARTTVVKPLMTEVLVVGGGPSGLAAALGAATSGATVTVVDAAFDGGRARVRTEPIFEDGKRVDDVGRTYQQLLGDARRHPSITLVTGQALGMLDGLAPVVHHQTRHEIAPARIIVATGSYEVPMLFTNNDRPGVMLADAALKLAEIENVRPGKRVVVATDSIRGHEVARRLVTAGCHVEAVVDARLAQEASATATWAPGSWQTLWNLRPQVVHGTRRTRKITFHGPEATYRLSADTLIIAGARRPADEFNLHVAYADAGSHDRVTHDIVSTSALRVGTASGEAEYDLTDIRNGAATWVKHPC